MTTAINVPAHPGTYLEGVLADKRISQSELARVSGISFQRINGIICGRRSITVDSALRIATVLGVPADELLARQSDYDLHVTRKSIARQLQKIKPLDA